MADNASASGAPTPELVRPASTPPGCKMPSPVDEILAMPPQGPSLLDSRPAGEPVPKWMWILPLLLALPGGIAGWLLLRGSNRAAGRAMLVVGIVVTVISVLAWGQMKALTGSLGF